MLVNTIPFYLVKDYRATTLLIQPCTAVIVKLSNESCIFSARFATMIAATSSDLGTDVFFFDKCDLLE